MANGEKPKPNLIIEYSVGPKQLFINQTLERLKRLTEEDVINEKITFTPEDFILIVDEVKIRSKDEKISEEEREKWMSLYRVLLS